MSTILSTLKLTPSEIERYQTAAQERRQATFERYQQQYPDAYVSDWFLLNIRLAENKDAPCADCQGYPCKKTSSQGFKHFVTCENGELNIRYGRCKYAKVANNKRIAKIPPLYAGKTFSDYRVDAGNANAVKGAKLLQSLFIFGNPGTGKTFLAALMAQELLERGQSVLFTDTPSLLDQMKSTFDPEAEATLEGVMQRLSKVDVLVLDDLGTETPTQWAVERLYLVINSRYNAQKSLIVTSNYDLQQVAEKLNRPARGEVGVTGSRIASRIRGLCKVVKIDGVDKRRS